MAPDKYNPTRSPAKPRQKWVLGHSEINELRTLPQPVKGIIGQKNSGKEEESLKIRAPYDRGKTAEIKII